MRWQNWHSKGLRSLDEIGFTFFVSGNQLVTIDGACGVVNLTDIGSQEEVAYAVIGNHLYMLVVFLTIMDIMSHIL